MGNSNCISTSFCDFDCCGYDGWCPTSSDGCYYYYPNAGVIAGAVIGSVAGLAIIIVIACYCYRQRQLERLRVELERNQSQAIYRHNNSMGSQPIIQMANGPQVQPIYYNQQVPPYQPIVGQPMNPPYLIGNQSPYPQGMPNQNIYYP